MVASFPSFVYIWLWKNVHPGFQKKEHNVVHHNMPRTSWITVNGCVFPTLMTTTREANCLFKEQDTSTLVSWQACWTQSGLSGNYLSTRSQCFITLSSLSQTSLPSSFADNDSGAVCLYGYEKVTASLLVHAVPRHSLWQSFLVQTALAVFLSCFATHWLYSASVRNTIQTNIHEMRVL